MKLLEYKHDEVPDAVSYYKQFYRDVLHTGSRVICNPAPHDTDDDWLLLEKENLIGAMDGFLTSEGFSLGGSGRYRRVPLPFMRLADAGQYLDQPVVERVPKQGLNPENFRSYKKHDLNIILTSKPDFFEKFKRATAIATGLNLLEKPVRVGLFEAVFDGTYPDDVNEQQKFLSELHRKKNEEAFKQPEERYGSPAHLSEITEFWQKRNAGMRELLINPPRVVDAQGVGQGPIQVGNVVDVVNLANAQANEWRQVNNWQINWGLNEVNNVFNRV